MKFFLNKGLAEKTIKMKVLQRAISKFYVLSLQ
jgi:hypothetical protein